LAGRPASGRSMTTSHPPTQQFCHLRTSLLQTSRVHR
jgi:hypothetical protein